MKVSTDLIARTLAEVEAQNEMIGDPAGIGASTIRIVVDMLGGAIKAEHPRFNTGAFQIAALPLQSERQKQIILAKLDMA